MSYVNSYEITLTMENNQTVIWEGYADDESHAEGLAMEYANRKTGEQVDHIDEINEFDQFEVLTEQEATELYDDMLDDCNEVVQVCGMSYNPSRVLKEVDPIAYNCGFSDFCDSLLDNHQLVEGYF